MVSVLALPNPLHLEVQEEAFSNRIVPAVALSAHAANEAMLVQQVLVELTGILPSPVPSAHEGVAGVGMAGQMVRFRSAAA